jgi:dienelactone hydrolase
MRRLSALLFLLFLATASAHAEVFEFESVAVSNALPAPERIKAWVYRPAKAGPAPAVIYGHTCGGLDEFSEIWAKRLASWGYLVITPDSYGARGIRNACLGGAPPTNLVSDVAGALDFLATRPDVEKGKVALLGNSAGGKLAIRAAQERYGLVHRGLRGGISLYGGACSAGEDRFLHMPLLALMAEKDDWFPIADCHAWVEATPQPPLQAHFYPARHGFDNSFVLSRAVPCRNGTCHLEYDAAVSADAEARTKTFLEQLFER